MHLTENFREIKRLKNKDLRYYLRELTLNAISLQTKIPSANKYFTKPRVQFLYIHHIFNDEIENFEILLKELSKTHIFISYSEAIEKILSGNIDKPYISISSDDGFKNNLAAVKVLSKFDAKCCFFINPDIIGETDNLKINTFCAKKLHMPPIEFMNWNDIDFLLKEGHEIGSHSMNHINFAKIGLSEVEDNLKKSYNIIKRRCGVIKHFAFPYGRYHHFSKESFKLVHNLGYQSCASAERGCHIVDGTPIEQNKLFIRRDQIICDWNFRHILYFILSNSKKASLRKNFY